MQNKFLQLLLVVFVALTSYGQTIYKPKGCSASTGPNVSTLVLQHPQDKYHLIPMEWANIEPSPGIFNFTALQNQINTVKSNHKKYALAIVGGGLGSPAWLIDTFKVACIDYLFRGTTPYQLPLWWDSMVQQRISKMVTVLGSQFAADTSLALVYVTQMSANGIEGHLNGIDMTSMYNQGFTASNWINAAKQTSYAFANAFPEKAIAFEVHEIDNSAQIPSDILNDLYNDPALCQRVGAAIWWLSGKISYQPGLLNVLQNFRGDKYAQLIGKSSETSRFENDSIASAFAQAKQLGVRYIEAWYYEYQNNTINDLLLDFNQWADAEFVSYVPCQSSTGISDQENQRINSIYPNPVTGYATIKISGFQHQTVHIQVFNVAGNLIQEEEVSASGKINTSGLKQGLYFIRLKDHPQQTMKFVKN